MSDITIREDRARRALVKNGYRLMKSHSRDPNAPTFGGYQIVETKINGVVAGSHQPGGFGLDLEQVEEWAGLTSAAHQERQRA